MKYKVIADGYCQHKTSDKYEAMEYAKKLSYSYDRVLVRTVKNNWQYDNKYHDMVISGNTVSFA